MQIRSESPTPAASGIRDGGWRIAHLYKLLLLIGCFVMVFRETRALVSAFELNLGLVLTTKASPAFSRDMLGASGEGQIWLQRAAAVDRQNIRPLVAMGKIAWLEDNSVEAEKYFTAALARAPDNQVAAIWLADVYEAEGDLDAAVKWWRVAKAASKLLIEAQRLEAADDWARAKERYLIATRVDPTAKEAWYGIARNAERLRMWHDAYKAYQQLASLEPRGSTEQREAQIEYYVTLGRALQADGNSTAAIDAYAEAARLNPSPEVFDLWARAALASGDDDAAIQILQESIRLNSNDLNARILLGLIHVDRQEYEDAKFWFAEAARMQPGSSPAQRGLGIVALKQGDWIEAERRYRRSLAIAPDSDNAYFYLGKALEAQGKYEAALTAYQKAWILRHETPYAIAFHRTACRLGKATELQAELREVTVYLEEHDPVRLKNLSCKAEDGN